MALRDYMQDLILAQTNPNDDDDHHEEINCIVNITIVDDNSNSALPDDSENVTTATCNLSLVNGYVNGARTPTNTRTCTHARTRGSHGNSNDGHGFLRISDSRDEERDESRAGETETTTTTTTTRIILDDFRRRQRFLRETLSPNRSTPRTDCLRLSFSPSPITTQWTPPAMRRRNDGDGIEDDYDDSQRGRMHRLKASLQIRGNSSPLV